LGGREDRVKVTIRPYGQPDAADLADVAADERDRAGYSALRSGTSTMHFAFHNYAIERDFAAP
jgi:hypothetical protein